MTESGDFTERNAKRNSNYKLLKVISHSSEAFINLISRTTLFSTIRFLFRDDRLVDCNAT